MSPRVVPQQRPGKNDGVFVTPDLFIRAVKHYLAIDEFVVDLAASVDNAKALRFLDEAHDSLAFDWGFYAGKGWCWLNPPFSNIEPWVVKCAANTIEGGLYQRGVPRVQIALLVPASIGSDWFTNYVEGYADIIPLKGRLSFDSRGPYPKDCVLCLYGARQRSFTSYQASWDWRKELAA